jgi:hypothetical protein
LITEQLQQGFGCVLKARMVVASARRRASAWPGIGTDEQISGLYVAVDEEILVQMRQACAAFEARAARQNAGNKTLNH